MGRERFMVYCTPCHGRLGERQGDGRPPRILAAARRFHSEYLRKIPVGHFYNVITHGYGAMYSYAARIPSSTAGPSPPTSGPSSTARTPSPDDLEREDRKLLAEWPRRLPGSSDPRRRQERGRGPRNESERNPLPPHRTDPDPGLARSAAARRRSAWSGPSFDSRADFDRAYLFSYIFVLGLALGSLALLDGPSSARRGLGILDPPAARSRRDDHAAHGRPVHPHPDQPRARSIPG